jgi:hypothetical protein
MSYEIKITAIVKTFGKEITHSQMREIISNALWSSKELRDVLIIDYEGDTLADLNPFSDIRQQILEESSSS